MFLTYENPLLPVKNYFGIGSKGGSLSAKKIKGGVALSDAEISRINPFDWHKEFPNVFPPVHGGTKGGSDGGFDAVIGNPPYVRIQTTGSNEIQYYPTRFRSAVGNYDIYCLFIEQGVSLLKTEGLLGHIVSHRFLKTDYGDGLREFLSERQYTREIIDFDGYMVFDNASTNTCLLVLSKTINPMFLFAQAKFIKAQASDVQKLLDSIESHSPNHPNYPAEKLPSSDLSKDPWILLFSHEKPLFKKLKNNPIHLADVTTHIFQGIKTSADSIYIVEARRIKKNSVEAYCKHDESTHQLETALLKPLIKGGQMKRYSVGESSLLLLFPYRDGKLISQNEIEDKYPHTWQYLHSHKKYLESREDGKMKGKEWYAYGRSQALNVMAQPKIITPDYYAHASFCYDQDGTKYFCGGGAGGYGILPTENVDIRFILGVLNSRMLDWYLHKISVRAYQTAFMYVKKYIEKLPIRTINFSDKKDKARHDKMVKLVERMLKLHEDLKSEWTSPNQEKIERQIKATDEEIDRLVYELYGLTEEEIRIVEGKAEGMRAEG